MSGYGRWAGASVAIATLALLCLGSTATTQVTSTLPDPHHHRVVDVHQLPWTTDLAPATRLETWSAVASCWWRCSRGDWMTPAMN